MKAWWERLGAVARSEWPPAQGSFMSRYQWRCQMKMTDEAVVRSALALECGGLGPNPGEQSGPYLERLAARVVEVLRHNGRLVNPGGDDATD